MKKVNLVLVFGLVAVLSLAGCTLSTLFGSTTAITGSGKMVTETRQVSGFNGVVLAAAGKMNIIQGDKEGLTITGDDNILALIKTEVRDGKLVIEFERPNISINSMAGITYNLTVVKLTSLQISGAGDITAANMKTESFTVVVSGAGNITIAGETGAQIITLSGAGNYSAADFKSQSVKVTISGAGNATV